MKLVYVSGPYRAYNKDKRSLHLDGVFHHILRARELSRELWRAGVAVICPHTNTALMDGDDIPTNVFIEGDLLMVRRVDAIVMVGDWRKSVGAQMELAEAERMGLPVFDSEDVHFWTDLRTWAGLPLEEGDRDPGISSSEVEDDS